MTISKTECYRREFNGSNRVLHSMGREMLISPTAIQEGRYGTNHKISQWVAWVNNIPTLASRLNGLIDERRASDRFPIERDIRYKVTNRKSEDETGPGRTVNMSSSGVLFATEASHIAGQRVELAISWPARLNNTVALKLVVRGRVVRSEHGIVAVEIQRYEFRTQGH